MSVRHQPRAVWATAFAAVVAFMGIGLVDPILPAIAANLDASPSQVSLLFTSYFAVTSLAMLLTGWVSSRVGARRTLLVGLTLVVVFASLSGLSDSVSQLVGFRAGWGLGNALFISTSLATIVGAASGGAEAAIVVYEAALGLGISVGPLLGALLGAMSWRFPFFGTAALMAVGLVAIGVLLGPTPLPARRTRLSDPLRALAHGGLRTTAVGAFFYNYAFFTVLAFTPFVLGMDAHGIGLVFFAWGLALAVTSVFAAPRLTRRHGTSGVLTSTMAALVPVVLVLAWAPSRAVVVAAVVASGAFSGVANTVFTEAAMEVSYHPRPIASAGYNCVRWLGGALAPFFAGKMAELMGSAVPYLVAAGAVAVAALVASRLRVLPQAPPGRSATSTVTLSEAAVPASTASTSASAASAGERA